jgi:hypothetical protein
MEKALEKFIFSNDEKLISYCLEAAPRFKEISLNNPKSAFCDKIIPENFNHIPFEPNQEKYIYFLRLKYVYYLSVKKGKSEDDLFLEYAVTDHNEKSKYIDVFNHWNTDDFINLEENVLLLRYNQLGEEMVLNYWYNDLPEFKEWLKCLIDSYNIINKFNDMFMGKHYKDNFSNVDYVKLNEFIVKCSNKFISLLSSGELRKDTFIQSFLCLITEIFDARLADHMIVNDNKSIEYNIVSDIKIEKTENDLLKQHESYSKGEGITGSLLVYNDYPNEDMIFHVGTNSLKNDKRQSDSHKNIYSEIYGINIDSFWVFPYFDKNHSIIGAFRVIDKNTSDIWTYQERATLLSVARWFEIFWSDLSKTLQPEKEFSFVNKNNKDMYDNLDIPWFNNEFFDLMLTHLKTTVNKKIENHSMGVCVAICKDDIISRILENRSFPEYQMQPLFFDSMQPVIFDRTKPRKVESSSLTYISLMYKTMHPLTAFCLYSSNGYFYGIRQLTVGPEEIPNITKVPDITNNAKESIVFLTQGDEKTIRIYKDQSFFADYYLSESDGDWRIRNFLQFKQVLDKTNIDSTITPIVCDLIFELSFKQIGSLLVFSSNEFDFIEEKDKDKELIEHNYIGNVNRTVFQGWASIDGAVLCTSDGHVKYVGAMLPKDTKSIISPYMNKLITTGQKGARHTTAVHYSERRKNDCIIAISQNKGISVLHNGRDLLWDDIITNALPK